MSTSEVREEVLQLRLRGLRLPGFLAHYAALAERSIAEGWGPIEYLTELVDVEVAERADRRLKRLLDEAELPAGKTLKSLELTRYAPQPKPPSPVMEITRRCGLPAAAPNAVGNP